MIKIGEFNKYNFRITWKVIELGFRSNSIFANQLYECDILEYAINKLEKECDELVCELASEYKGNSEAIACLLSKLAEKENTNLNLELRKWRVILVGKELQVKNDNFINGLIDLSDLWIKLDFPKDSPHIFQGKGNELTVEEYYTQQNYENLYEKHKVWLREEVRYIQDNQW